MTLKSCGQAHVVKILSLCLKIKSEINQQNAELIELKLALKNAGIDYTMILKDYRAQKEMELKEWEGNSGY